MALSSHEEIVKVLSELQNVSLPLPPLYHEFHYVNYSITLQSLFAMKKYACD